MKKILLTLLVLVSFSCFGFSETMPDAPQHYFNDYAGLVSADKAAQWDKQLTDLDTATSTQFVVAIFPVMDTDSSLEDYTQRIAHNWKVGSKAKNNGVVLFVFVKASDGHTKIRIEVGYGLEGALPDAIAKNIIQYKIIPHFKSAKAGKGQPEWEAGLSEGINGIIAATKNEYKIESPATTGESTDDPLAGHSATFWIVIALIVIVVLIIIIAAANSDDDGFGGGFSSWSSGGSDSSSSSDSGFSGGGGDFGGGGASGDC